MNSAEKLTRISVPALDEILGVPFPVLDNGFVRVIDYMGTDESIVQAARVSYGKGTKKLHEDRGLIRYLLRHRHTSPLEMCDIKLHIRVPMDTWRQWIRHRTASVNEYSTRYSIAIEEVQETAADAWRIQTNENRMGSSGFIPEEEGGRFSAREKELHKMAHDVYNERIEAGIAREQARKDLPLSTYTEAYWKINLHNLLHFLELRMDKHAQLEVRSYANVIGNEILSRWCPLVWEAFSEYQLSSFELSGVEQSIISAAVKGMPEKAVEIAMEHGMLRFGETGPNRNLEREELEAKMSELGVPVPWQGAANNK
jgi:thymidylate synthase (FAD)